MAFHFDEPELEVFTTLTVYPGLTNWRRLRAELRVDLRRELVTDLFWGFSFYGSLDNEPTGLETESEDVAVVASLGWKY